MFKLGWAYLRAGQKEKGLVQMRRSITGGETNIYNQIKLCLTAGGNRDFDEDS